MILVGDYEFDCRAELTRKLLESLERFDDTKDQISDEAYISSLKALNDVSRGLVDSDINFAIDDVLSAQTSEFPKVVMLLKEEKVIVVSLRFLSATVKVLKDGNFQTKEFETGSSASDFFKKIVETLMNKGYEVIEP